MLEARPKLEAAPTAPGETPTTDPKSEMRLEGEGGGGTAVGAEDPDAPAAHEHPAQRPVDPRLGRHRRHHELHEHVEPVGDGGRGPAGEEGRREGAGGQALGQVQPGPRIEGRDRLPARRRADPYLDQLRFNLVGYGCTTCIGNSGPLSEDISEVIQQKDLVAVSVLSGNRNFEGRINSDVRANYLVSPPLVVAYALAGTMDIDLSSQPLGTGSDGKPVFLKDIWPTQKEVQETILKAVRSEHFHKEYGEVFEGDEQLEEPAGTDRRPLRLGRRVDVRQEPALLRGHGGQARAGRCRSADARARPFWATASRPTTSPPPVRSRRTVRPANT